MFEQHRLADAGLAAEHEHPTLPTPHARKQRVEDRTLAAAAPQLGVYQLVNRKVSMLAARPVAVNLGAAEPDRRSRNRHGPPARGC
jgi:hypothetical protein